MKAPDASPQAVSYAGAGEVREAHRFDEARLRAWLALEAPDVRGPMTVRQFNGGQSNPTYDLQFPDHRLVLRRKPPGQTLTSAHAVDREFRVTRALAGAGVPVARPLAYCADPDVVGSEFYVCEFVAGRVLWDPKLETLPFGERYGVYEAMAATLAQLHSVDPAGAGLADFGRPGDYFMRQITRWTRQYQSVNWGRVDAIDRLIEWLPKNMPMPPEAVAVVHGDFRLDNLIFHPARPEVLAILDWELSTLGHPLGDLSYQCMQWRLPPAFFGGLAGVDRTALGLPSEADYVAMYCDRMGWGPIPCWEHYLVYNYFKFAAIVHGVAHRASTGAASNPRAQEFAALIEPTAELGWHLAQEIGSV